MSLFPELAKSGLNLQAAFTISDLPPELINTLSEACAEMDQYRQVILLGHAGRDFWQALLTAKKTSKQTSSLGKGELIASDNPVDSFTLQQVDSYFQQEYPAAKYQCLYPGDQPVDLQAFGRLAGWHGDSPFRLGVNKQWGSWYAYRALVLIDKLPSFDEPCQVKTSSSQASPCTDCSPKPCVAACPVGALGQTHSTFKLQACLDYRVQPGSACSHQCLARSDCPVGKQHKYDQEQMQYHYGVSLEMIKKWQKRQPF